jgi:hypothetical protein
MLFTSYIVKEPFSITSHEKHLETTVADPETYRHGQVHGSIDILASQQANNHINYLGRSLQTWYASSAFYAS